MPLSAPVTSGQSCAVCGQSLTAHQAASGSVCDRHPCRHQAALQTIAASKKKARALLMADATRRRNRIAARLKLAAPDELPIALVPASTRRSTLPPASRQRLFREHLEAVLTRLAQTPAPRRSTQPPDEPADATPHHIEPPAVDAACSTCRGYCCQRGGVKAYIDEGTLQRFALAHPSLDRNETVRAYIGHLPERSMKDSCVFHGELGCTLPRDMRSATCNDYRCASLQNLLARDAGSLLITAATEVKVVRSTVFANARMADALPSPTRGSNER